MVTAEIIENATVIANYYLPLKKQPSRKRGEDFRGEQTN
jgi:hypothetical protein